MGGDELTGQKAVLYHSHMLSNRWQDQRRLCGHLSASASGVYKEPGLAESEISLLIASPTDKISMNVWSSTSVPTATPCEEPISQESLIYRQAGPNLPSTRIRPFEYRSLDPPITRREMIALRYPLHQHSPCNVRCICCGGTLAPAFQGHSRGRVGGWDRGGNQIRFGVAGSTFT
ncbi:uncharacterized protein BO66DRAFT_8308 [Aspergillus aculeatinus CBS 121060]|uniref:Uncharacterized protein n=1 Tax=Aspergillus aculeatinus CBS 121060 TaxID=1448322 RepID=A0ACD1HP14_9EURO|nr:hypothetical protein BO66DRAFT_8308 [Aspergillus aculeatinus CBS 121060]RAH75427.1 hypothetical protein BO66DRAFT_8308 [Aspergillus aculeatinus CBS 121060]